MSTEPSLFAAARDVAPPRGYQPRTQVSRNVSKFLQVMVRSSWLEARSSSPHLRLQLLEPVQDHHELFWCLTSSRKHQESAIGWIRRIRWVIEAPSVWAGEQHSLRADRDRRHRHARCDELTGTPAVKQLATGARPLRSCPTPRGYLPSRTSRVGERLDPHIGLPRLI